MSILEFPLQLYHYHSNTTTLPLYHKRFGSSWLQQRLRHFYYYDYGLI